MYKKTKGYAMGGMVKKTKGYAKGGMTKKTKGYAMGGAAKKTKGYAKGGMAKKTKGYAMGGMAKRTKGYAKGGMAGRRKQFVPNLISNIPYFRCWVRREFTCNHTDYHGEFIHAYAIAVNTIPDRSLSFQVVFTGCEIDNDDLAHPWDCESRDHSVITMDRVSSSPWICKIGNKFHTGKYLFTVDYTNNEIADDPAQHKQSHVLYLTDAGKWTGNFVALPNNRVRATSPALWRTGEGAPDFMPSQWTHSAQ